MKETKNKSVLGVALSMNIIAWWNLPVNRNAVQIYADKIAKLVSSYFWQKNP
jgi:hypothetical protein